MKKYLLIALALFAFASDAHAQAVVDLDSGDTSINSQIRLRVYDTDDSEYRYAIVLHKWTNAIL